MGPITKVALKAVDAWEKTGHVALAAKEAIHSAKVTTGIAHTMFNDALETGAKAVSDMPVHGATGLFKPVEKGFSNAYTGQQTTMFGDINLVAAGAGIGVGAGIWNYNALNTYGTGRAFEQRASGPVAYSGNPQSYAYDGSANVNSATGKYDLGASGDLVLAMSANRRSR